MAVSLDEGETLEQAVNKDIAEFQEFFVERVDNSGGLSGPEVAILKTWLWWKTHPEEADGEG